MTCRRPFLAFVVALGLLEASPAQAIPAFARRYEVDCIFCHDGFPKLNGVGQRFKEHGFRLERENAFDVSRWLRSVPVVLRAEGNRTFIHGGGAFNTGVLKAISAGNLGSRFSYWVDDGEVIVSTPTGHDASNTKPDNAWLRYELLENGRLYAKAARFELDIPFTQARTPHLFPYEVYGGNTGFEPESIGVHKDGLELGGDLPRSIHWSAAVVRGHSEDLSGNRAGVNPNVFLRMAKRWGRDRVGAFAYFGKSTIALPPNLNWDDHQLRLGVDASVWIERLNLYGVYLYGYNDNSLADPAHPSGTGVSASFNGGFLQADYQLKDFVSLTLRGGLLSRPPGGTLGPSETFTSLYPGIQIFIFEHGKVSFEYGFQNHGQAGIGQIQAEVVF
jgi:hypothetical protein